MNIKDRLNAIENGFENIIFENILKNGTIEYRNKEGLLHNINDQPVEIYPNGIQIWCQHGKRYRDNNLPLMIEKRNIIMEIKR